MTIADRNKNRQVMRGKIDGVELLEDVIKIAKDLAKCARLGNINPQTVAALRASADIQLKVLNKVLPDVKSVENDEGEYSSSMNDRDLNERIRQLIDRFNERGGDAGVTTPAAGTRATH